MMLKKLIFMAIAVGIVGMAVPSRANLLLFEDPNNLGVTLDGSMTWNDTGGGHLYMEQYFDDDVLYFSEPTFVNSFQMDGMPWENFGGGTTGLVDVAAFDEADNQIWETTVDLSSDQQWDQWTTVPVQTADVSKMTFYSPYYTHYDEFWPSIDNMAINESSQTAVNVIPEPHSLWLLCTGLIGLMELRPRRKK